MAPRIVLLSGPIASGKSTLADGLCERFGALALSTRDLLRANCGEEGATRGKLQALGNRLDVESNGRWTFDALRAALMERGIDDDRDAIVVLDSVRTKQQIHHIRVAYSSRVVHVHLTGDRVTLAKRFAARKTGIAEPSSYDEARGDPTEQAVDTLEQVADVVERVDSCTAPDLLVKVAGHLGLYGRAVERCVDVLVGGQYGSEGKGNIAAYLAPEYDVLIRVGGPNAGHSVFRDGEPYVYHQLPSGTHRADHATVVLGPGSVLDLERVQKEIGELALGVDRLFIDPNAIIICDADVQFESSGLVGDIGSTGQGVGSATARKVLRTRASPAVQLARDVGELRGYIRETRQVLEDAYAKGQKVMLEGTQGTGLSIHHGPYPYTTSRDTSVSGCLAEAGIPPGRVRRSIMVCRSYVIRVQSPPKGSSGPMRLGAADHSMGEITWDEVAKRSGHEGPELQRQELTSTTKRQRRVGEFDWSLLRAASTLNAPTDIAFTFADYISIENQKARRFEQLTEETIHFVEQLERVASAPVSLIATRFDIHNVIDRRQW